jgi:signal transduction histidine kinase
MVVVGFSSEHEQQWRNGLQGARLSNLVGDARHVSQLRAGEVLSIDISQVFLRDQAAYKLVTPILMGGQLAGILLLGYGSIKPNHTSNELAILKAIARLASLVIERERAQNERNHALQELQAANEELEHANKVKTDFISIVSHEFRTALTGIQGFSEMMRDKDFSIMEMKEFAADIHSDAQRLTRLIKNILDLDRMESGRMHLSLGWLDMNAIITDVTGRLRPTAPNHLLRLQLASALPILKGDRDKLTQVVANLLNNAIKYSPDGGDITITSQVEGAAVHVSVKDQGVGIEARHLERIFERYARVESDNKYYIDGTGLGLPIVRQIVQLHGGHVWVESTPGEGSIFHFTVQFAGNSAGHTEGKDGKDSLLRG